MLLRLLWLLLVLHSVRPPRLRIHPIVLRARNLDSWARIKVVGGRGCSIVAERLIDQTAAVSSCGSSRECSEWIVCAEAAVAA